MLSSELDQKGLGCALTPLIIHSKKIQFIFSKYQIIPSKQSSLQIYHPLQKISIQKDYFHSYGCTEKTRRTESWLTHDIGPDSCQNKINFNTPASFFGNWLSPSDPGGFVWTGSL